MKRTMKKTAKETAVLCKTKGIVARVMEDETILLPIYKTSDEINCIYTLNKVASRVWELIDGKRTLVQLKGMLLKEFDTTPAELDKEMKKLLDDLKKIQAIK